MSSLLINKLPYWSIFRVIAIIIELKIFIAIFVLWAFYGLCLQEHTRALISQKETCVVGWLSYTSSYFLVKYQQVDLLIYIYELWLLNLKFLLQFSFYGHFMLSLQVPVFKQELEWCLRN